MRFCTSHFQNCIRNVLGRSAGTRTALPQAASDSCSPREDVQQQIKIAMRVAVPRKPYSLLLASYTTAKERRLPLKFYMLLLLT